MLRPVHLCMHAPHDYIYCSQVCTFATLNCGKVCNDVTSKLLHYMFVSDINRLFYIACMLGHPEMAHAYCTSWCFVIMELKMVW